MIRFFLALYLGKLIFFLTRYIKIGGGSAAPGYYALKIDPFLTQNLAKQISQNVVITGTNGKTTTSRMLAQFVKGQNIKVIRNATGSNLERGVASTLIAHSNLFGQIKNYDLGIWELDEAAFNSTVLMLNPQIIVFLNAFRDQLDRYGEVDTVVQKWCSTLSKINSDTYVLINGDDVNTQKLKDCFKGKIETFGLEDYKIGGEMVEVVKPVKLDFEAKKIKILGLDGSTFEINGRLENLKINLPIPGTYHIYDFLAAFLVYFQLNLPTDQIPEIVKKYTPAFGRVEKIKFKDQDLMIFLIKNPTGATQVFQTISGEIDKDDTLVIALNDNFADGTDVSWIWDANFEQLTINNEGQALLLRNQQLNFICSGTRAQDLSLRLKYAGIASDQIIVENDLKMALEHAKRHQKGRIFVLPTYTALLELQHLLARKGVKSEYWKEN